MNVTLLASTLRSPGHGANPGKWTCLGMLHPHYSGLSLPLLLLPSSLHSSLSFLVPIATAHSLCMPLPFASILTEEIPHVVALRTCGMVQQEEALDTRSHQANSRTATWSPF